MGEITVSVLLKLFINENERCHFTDDLAHKRNCFLVQAMLPGGFFFHQFNSNVNNIQSMIPEDKKNKSTQCCSTWWHFTAATQALNLHSNFLSSISHIHEASSSQRRKQIVNELLWDGILLYNLQIHMSNYLFN